MALTPTDPIELGSLAPNFALHDTVSGDELHLNQIKGAKGSVIMFICNHCPFVLHINSTIADLAKEYQEKGISFIAISSNDVLGYPQDGPEQMKALAKKEGFTFPYLYDETQDVAKAYGAQCTPDIYLYNEGLELFYHGQLDDSRPGNDIACDGKDLRNAMDALLKQKNAPELQKPGIGCNIKWK